MKTPQEIIEILRSIDDVRFNESGEFEVKFWPPAISINGGWEKNSGYDYGSFTQQLLLLIEDTLKED
jgi:hypothetical protein